MRTTEVLAAIAAARNAGSFTFNISFAMNAEIFAVRHFVTSLRPMLKQGGMEIEDETMMKLMAVAVRRRWQEDTDRLVAVTMHDDFDAHQFAIKIEPILHDIDGIEAAKRAAAGCAYKTRASTMAPKPAIRKAYSRGERNVRIVISEASRIDLIIFEELVQHKFITFVSPDERMVFDEATRRNEWTLGGRLSAQIIINRGLPEHAGGRIMDGAHVRVSTVKPMR